MEIMMENFGCRLYNMLVVNVCNSIMFPWKFISKFLGEDTLEKVHFFSDKIPKHLL